MSRSTQVLLAAAIVCLTIAGGVFVAPVAPGATRPDLTWLVLTGVAATVGVFAVDTRLVRWFIDDHFPLLRSSENELSRIVAEGVAFMHALDDVPPDSVVPADQVARLNEWAAAADIVVERRFGNWAPFYEHSLPPPLIVGAAVREAYEWLQSRYFNLRNHLNDIHGGHYHGILS